jgi:hypothetical protein
MEKNVLHNSVKLKIFADKNICGKYFCGCKIALLRKEHGHLITANIITANIFIRKFFIDDGRLKVFFPRENFSFPGQKIGTIFCPKGPLGACHN